ncbi:MAG: DUF1206 domain-containing protein [Firmicutes bacterium]|nr:DUF1206 domain-containing protein [Bacillota bacterium]
MSVSTNTTGQNDKTAQQVVHDLTFSPIVSTLARWGYAARGVIYFAIGLSAILLAFGSGGKATDQQGAIATIGNQPAGRILLGLVLIGLISYSLWGLIRALLNPLHKGNDLKGIAERIGFFFSAIAYALLVLPTYAIIIGGAQPARTGVQGAQTRHYVSDLLGLPLGQWLVGAVGILVILVGLFQVYQAIRPDFDRQIHLSKLTPSQANSVKRIGRLGTIARGIVFALIGMYLTIAAYTANSYQVKGFDATLIALLYQPYGRWLMGIIALGLIALGIYSLCAALFFRLGE